MKFFLLFSALLIGATNGQGPIGNLICRFFPCPSGTKCQVDFILPHCVAVPTVPTVPPTTTTAPSPGPNCGENEYYTDCYNSCEEKKCPVRLIAPPSICPPDCVRGCACQDGYVRNRRRQCVLESECPPIGTRTPPPTSAPTTPPTIPPLNCLVNEYPIDCYNPCYERKCPTNVPLPPCLFSDCLRGCTCQNGYVRNAQGRCVRDWECPPIVTTTVAPNTPTTPPLICPPYEYPIDCYNPCYERKCPTNGPNPPCLFSDCFRGCTCQNGYYRNLQGRCVTNWECPPIVTTTLAPTSPTTPPLICPPYEYPIDCYNPCYERKCPTNGPNPPCLFSECFRGCTCQNGYVRNAQGRCVRNWECPPIVTTTVAPTTPTTQPLICPPYEYPIDCYNPCTERKCPTNGPNPPCLLSDCFRGCTCQNGYVRNAQGRCVRNWECPPIVITTLAPTTQPTTPPTTCPPNEYFDNCHNDCKEKKCPKERSKRQCLLICTVGCSCVNGTVRNDRGQCVKEVDCPPIGPPIGFCNLFCRIGFRCVIVNRKPRCVPIPPPICPPNEYWDACHNSCTEKKCPSNEPPVHPCDPIPCTGGCSCQNGYVRNLEGQCVREDDCPSICPVNEYWDLCHNSCSEKKCPRFGPGPICPLLCTRGCSCLDGYVRNSEGQCVPEDECPPIFPPTVPPSTCAHYPCPRRTHCYMVYGCPTCPPRPQCLAVNPCRFTRCRRHQECVLVQVFCFAPPCYPTAECRQIRNRPDHKPLQTEEPPKEEE